MKTTSVIVEVLISGFFTLLWILVYIVIFSKSDLNFISEVLFQYKEWSLTISLTLLAVCYQLGWNMNFISILITSPLISKPIKNKVFQGDDRDYSKIRGYFLTNATPNVVTITEEIQRTIRLARVGFINFFLTAVGFFILNAIIIGFVFLLLSTINLFMLTYRTKLKYQLIRDIDACAKNEFKLLE